jgi:hypothetical protein
LTPGEKAEAEHRRQEIAKYRARRKRETAVRPARKHGKSWPRPVVDARMAETEGSNRRRYPPDFAEAWSKLRSLWEPLDENQREDLREQLCAVTLGEIRHAKWMQTLRLLGEVKTAAGESTKRGPCESERSDISRHDGW